MMLQPSSFYRVTHLAANLCAIEDIKSTEHSISYLMWGANRALLFDTGLGLSPLLPLLQSITDLPITACLSHWHFDHSGGAHEFTSLIGWSSPAMHAASQHGISDATIHTEVDGAFWQSIGQVHMSVQPFKHLACINQEQSIDLGDCTVDIIHTPGHTKDSICLYLPSQQWLFTGDTAYPGKIYLQFEDSSAEAYDASLQKLANYPINTIFPGHNALSATPSLMAEIVRAMHDADYRSVAYPRVGIRYAEEQASSSKGIEDGTY